MKNSLVVVVGLLLTATSLFFYRYEPDVVRSLAQTAHDSLLRSTHRPAVDSPVVVVDIDELSLRDVGQFPWPRYLVADLADKLFEAGASVVAFDVLFAEPDGKAPKQVLAGLQDRFGVESNLSGVPDSLLNFDGLLQERFRDRNVVIGCFMLDEDAIAKSDEPEGRGFTNRIFLKSRDGSTPELAAKRLNSYWGMTAPIPELADAVAGIGYINAMPDDDNIARRSVLVWPRGESQFVPSLSLEALRQHLEVNQISVEYDITGIRAVRLRDQLIPTDPFGRMLLNYRTLQGRPPHSMPYLSAVHVLDGTFEPETVDGRIVFVGSSATALADVKATPLTRAFPGVETHATVVENVLSRDVLRYPPWFKTAELGTILLMGLFLTVIIHRGRPWLAVLVTGLLVIGSLTASVELLRRFNAMVLPTQTLLSVTMIYTVLTSIRYWQEESRRKSLRKMFGSAVSRRVLTFLEENPDRFSMEGQNVDATMFFSDIAGFTSIAESLSAGEVTNLLNRYLDAMNRIILDRDGYLDKFQGDAIMAVWGVPYQTDDHAAQACLAALEQAEKLGEIRAEIREQFGYEVWVRMGINTGPVKAGYMGSEDRRHYSVLGDAVNQAARLEPTNKQYGSYILIGQNTYDQTRDVVECRRIDQVMFKGKSETVQVYELLSRKGELSRELARLREHYEKGLELYWSGRDDEALGELDQALTVVPDDGPSLALIGRIRAGDEEEDAAVTRQTAAVPVRVSVSQ